MLSTFCQAGGALAVAVYRVLDSGSLAVGMRTGLIADAFMLATAKAIGIT